MEGTHEQQMTRDNNHALTDITFSTHIQQMMQQLQQHNHHVQQAGHSAQHHDGGVDELLDSDSSDEEDHETSQWNEYGVSNGFQQVSHRYARIIFHKSVSSV